MSKKLSKEDIKGPDAFITASDKVIKIIEQNAKAIFGGLAAIILVVGGWATYSQIQKSTETRLQGELFVIQDQINKLADPAAGAKDPKDLEKYAQPIEQLKSFVAANAVSQAGAMAAIELSDLYFTHKEYELAKGPLNEVLPHIKKSDLMYGLVQSRLATSYMALDENDKAVEALKQVSENKNQKYLHGDSWLKLGLAHQKAGQQEEAIKAYEKVIADYPESFAARTATSLIRFLSFSN